MERYYHFAGIIGLNRSHCHHTKPYRTVCRCEYRKKEAPLLFYKVVYGNELTTIRYLDKKGNEKILPVTNHTGIRITKADNSKVTFFLILQDSSIADSKSHFFKVPVKIYFNEITNVVVQK